MPTDNPKTVKATIWAAVDHLGAWTANGWGTLDKTTPMKDALFVDDLEEGERRFRIVVELPIPVRDAEPVDVVEVTDAD